MHLFQEVGGGEDNFIPEPERELHRQAMEFTTVWLMSDSGCVEADRHFKYSHVKKKVLITLLYKGNQFFKRNKLYYISYISCSLFLNLDVDVWKTINRRHHLLVAYLCSALINVTITLITNKLPQYR